MEKSILVALVGALSALVGAGLSHVFGKWRETEAEWRKWKFKHYRELLLAISDLAGDKPTSQDYHNFAAACNTIVLVAPQRVVRALVEFHDAIALHKRDLPKEQHDSLLRELLLAIRKDMRVTPSDNERTFLFRLIGQPPKSE